MEQSFRKIATAGIVKLFNAVREHQKKIDGENEKKKEALSKEKFMELLKSTSSSQKEQVNVTHSTTSKEKEQVFFLRSFP